MIFLFLGAEKKIKEKKKGKKETPEYCSLLTLLIYYSIETNTFYKMKAILKNSLEEITATQGSYYLYSQLHQSLIFIVMVLFLFWWYKNVLCGFSLNNKCASRKTAWKKRQLQISAANKGWGAPLFNFIQKRQWDCYLERESKIKFSQFPFSTTICAMQSRFYAISCSYYNFNPVNWDGVRMLISKYII